MATYQDGADYIKTSIRGRRLGLDDYDCLRGANGQGVQVEYLTSADNTAAATLYPCGVTALNAATSSTALLLTSPSAKMVGVYKCITSLTTATTKITLATGAFGTSTGAATCTVMTSTGIGQTVRLFYASSDVVQVFNNSGTVTFA